LMLEHLRHGARDARLVVGLALVLTCFISVFGALAGALLGLAFLGRGEGNAGSPRLRKADGDGLFRRPCAMLAAADLVDLLANELTSLSGGRLALALGLAGFLDGSFLRHVALPRPASLQNSGSTPHRLELLARRLVSFRRDR